MAHQPKPIEPDWESWYLLWVLLLWAGLQLSAELLAALAGRS